jgi:hypothetical protein
VRFEDEEFEDHEEGSNVENPFGRGGKFDRRHHHRCADFEDRGFTVVVVIMMTPIILLVSS